MDDYIPVIERSLRRVTRVLSERTRQHLSQFDLTMPQFQSLMILTTNGEMTAGDLSKRMFLNSATITGIIDRLNSDGLVVRSRNQWDRRIVNIAITDKGEERANNVLDYERNYLDQAMKGLKMEHKEQLASSLDLLYHLLVNKERIETEINS